MLWLKTSVECRVGSVTVWDGTSLIECKFPIYKNIASYSLYKAVKPFPVEQKNNDNDDSNDDENTDRNSNCDTDRCTDV